MDSVRNVSPENHVTLLDISIKNLTKLPGKLFHNVSIEGLVVSSGRLEYVHSKAFYGLEKQLTALGLPDNQLTSMPMASLQIMKLLTRLDLSGNCISSIHTLPSLPDLEYLDLSRNAITILAAGVTQPLPHLKTLLLSGNLMESSTLSHYNLQHLSYLETLDISQNRIAGWLEQPALDLFPPNLKTLDMSFNRVEGIRGNTFRSLSALKTLNLQGNMIEEIKDLAFLGLLSLTSLDLSHNSILTLGDESLTGLPSLESLSLSHNHLQVVSSLWMIDTPLLRELLVMDNDITNVEEDAFTGLEHLTEINLAGNPLSCDCHISSFYSFLHASLSLSNSSFISALCATPILLTNAPLYQLPPPPECDTISTDISNQMDTPKSGDYYEYYSENPQEGSGTFLSSAEIQLLHSEYNKSSNHLYLTWRVDEAAIPYKCGQLHVFEEKESEGVVLVTHDTLACDDDNDLTADTLHVSLDMEKYQLSFTKPYIICISLVQDQSVIPGCSGSLSGSAPDQVSIQSLEEQSCITSLHANVSVTHDISVYLRTRVSSNMDPSCKVRVSVGVPSVLPTVIGIRTFNCSVSKYVFTGLPAHNYYNVCAVLQVEESNFDQQELLELLSRHGQCMIVSAPRVRYQLRSVMPLVLTLVFLALGIACLTVLYLIVKRHREDSKQEMFKPRDTPILNICWRLRYKKGKPNSFLNDVDDEHL